MFMQIFKGKRAYFVIGFIIAFIAVAQYKFNPPESDFPEDTQSTAGNVLSYSKSIPAVNGPRFSFKDYRKGLSIVNVWASWCPSCRQEMPTLIQLKKSYHQKNILKSTNYIYT